MLNHNIHLHACINIIIHLHACIIILQLVYSVLTENIHTCDHVIPLNKADFVITAQRNSPTIPGTGTN